MFATPLGLLALLAVPAIVALHLFRRRFQPRVVSALFLWSEPDPTPLSGRKRERLRSSGSLLCEILAALCIALFLAGPQGCAGQSPLHLVVVVDGSASMGARSDDGKSFVDAARDRVGERIDALPGGSRVTIVASASRPRLLAGPAAFPREAREALARFEPAAVRHDMLGAVALGLQLSGGGSVVLVTDRFSPDDLPPEVDLVAVGRPLDNVAIVHASRDRERVSVTLASFAGARREVRASAVLPLSGGQAVIQPQTVALEPGERRTFGFDVAAGTGPIEVRIDADALAIDDSVVLAPQVRRKVALRTNLPEERARVLGLSVSGGSLIGRWLQLAPDVVEARDDASAHLLLTDRESGGPATWTLRLAQLGGERRDFIGPFLAEKRHPVLEGTTLEGIVWSADPTLLLEGAPIVAAGNLPLLVEDRSGDRRAYVIDIDPARSSLQRSPDWPILLSNLVEERRRELPGASAANLVVGDEATWRSADAGEAARLRIRCPGPDSRRETEGNRRDPSGRDPSGRDASGGDPSGREIVERETADREISDRTFTEREITERAVTVLDGFDQPGLYTLERNGQVVARFGVRFQDAHESDLRELSSGARETTVAAATAPPVGSWIELLLIGLVVAALLLDWFLLDRPHSVVRREPNLAVA